MRRFTRALANKLLAAQRKYGYSDNWMRDGWADECRAELMRHIQKGDPRDVAAYCAFLWHHNESTAPSPIDERAPFDLTDMEWLNVFERVSATIPNVFGGYMKVRAAFAREAIRLADEARTTAPLVDKMAALIAERDAAIMSTHRQAMCIQQCAAHIGRETAATIDGLPLAVKRLVEERDAARAAASPAAEAVAWVRKHPDTGELSGDWLWNDAIEQCRKDSGVWFPLGFLGARPALPEEPAAIHQVIHQVWVEETSSWADVTPVYYAERQPSNRRRVYYAPQPAQPAQADAPAHATECPHCDGEGVIEADGGASPCACAQDAQEGMPTFGARRTQADAPAEAREPNQIYVEVRQCDRCDHIGINDGHATDAACGYPCGWSGPSPVEDKCPGCGHENVMSVACPKCSGHYSLLANGLFETNEVSELAEAREPIETAQSIAADCYHWIAERIGTKDGYSVQEHVDAMCQVIDECADFFHDFVGADEGGNDEAVRIAKNIRALKAGMLQDVSAPADAGEAAAIVRRQPNGAIAMFAPDGKPFDMSAFVGATFYTAPPSARVESLTDVPSLTNPLTPYGMLVRALRIISDTLLGDMAKHLGCSSAMLSAIEVGRMPLTDAMIADTAAYFSSVGIPDTLHALNVASRARALLNGVDHD
ncbi:hypothetical protein Y023_5062 [Burkholderia pseudomallei A79D]|nr:hypothetical protein Y023_5062 [Burkholderia pseudomallei A79D]